MGALKPRNKPPKPKPLGGPIEVAEPATFLGKGAETISVPRKIVRCSDCGFYEEWRDGLCLDHWKKSQGFIFDDETRRYRRKK